MGKPYVIELSALYVVHSVESWPLVFPSSKTSVKVLPISYSVSCVTTLLPYFLNTKRLVVRVTMLPPMAARRKGMREVRMLRSPKSTTFVLSPLSLTISTTYRTSNISVFHRLDRGIAWFQSLIPIRVIPTLQNGMSYTFNSRTCIIWPDYWTFGQWLQSIVEGRSWWNFSAVNRWYVLDWVPMEIFSQPLEKLTGCEKKRKPTQFTVSSYSRIAWVQSPGPMSSLSQYAACSNLVLMLYSFSSRTETVGKQGNSEPIANAVFAHPDMLFSAVHRWENPDQRQLKTKPHFLNAFIAHLDMLFVSADLTACSLDSYLQCLMQVIRHNRLSIDFSG